MSDNVVIKADNLWKRYGLPLGPAIRRLSRRVRGQSTDNPDADGPWALRDVSFEVKQGETLGIIGRNGAGKSTLLKVLAGVTPPTRGQVHVAGTIFPMIELNAGLHVELTGRENVRLLGAIMGLNRAEIAVKMPQIEAFCELGEWFDRPVRKYSSGMLTRLGFAVAVNVDADILLIDEVLSVGDLAFQKKCYSEIEALHRKDVTILFVSHNIRQIERICSRVMHLDGGRVQSAGAPDMIYYEYMKESSEYFNQAQAKKLSAERNVRSSGEIDITNVEILDENRQPSQSFHTRDTICIRTEYVCHERLDNPILSINVLTSDMIDLAVLTGEWRPGSHNFSLTGQGYLELVIPDVPFLPDVYSISLNIKSSNGRNIYKGENLAQFTVQHDHENRKALGLVHVDFQWLLPDAEGDKP